MNPFDLEKALAGEPVLLLNSNYPPLKAYLSRSKLRDDGIIVEFEDENRTVRRHSEKWIKDFGTNIVMWQEPRPRVQLGLPCPLKEVKNGTTVYYISINTDPLGVAYSEIVVDQTVFDEENHYHKTYLDGGFYFTTKEEAQEWLDAMRNARR